MIYDLKEIAFSVYGSYFAVSYFERYFPNRKSFYIRTVSGGPGGQDFYNISPMVDGKDVLFTETATPTLLTLETISGKIKMCMPNANEIRICGKNSDFHLYLEHIYRYAYASVITEDTIIMSNQSGKIAVKILEGSFTVSSPWADTGYGAKEVDIQILCDKNTNRFEIALHTFWNSYKPMAYPLSFEQCLAKVENEYNQFLNKMPKTDEKYIEAREKAIFLIWSSTISARGLLTRDGVLMSKNLMNSIWSWDHCFNALALMHSYPDLAWDQFMLPFDFIDEHGSLQDSINDSDIESTFVKPPIHGFILRKMMNSCNWLDDEKLNEIYPLLCRWTNWWFEYMDFDNDCVPQYMHGNDSGWDNSTVFRKGTPVESPDLSAFLVEQMDVLSVVAGRLNKVDEAQEWKQRANELLARMLEHFTDSETIFAVKSFTHERIDSDSLLIVMPMILGERLPYKTQQALLKKAKEYITEYGFATEKIDSKYYTPDGYWRGPIWAPSSYLLYEGLIRLGETTLATEIAEKFVNMCANSGMAENFDALTGEGLRDLSYTWTASVFLLFANELIKINR